MFNIDPSGRPNINEVLFHLENIAQTKSFQFSETLNFLKKTESLLQSNSQAASHVNSFQQSVGAASSSNNNLSANTAHSNSNWMGNASSLFKGNSLLKTIKDASTKVMDTVQRFYFYFILFFLLLNLKFSFLF